MKQHSFFIAFLAVAALSSLGLSAQTKASDNTLTVANGSVSYSDQTYTSSSSDANCVKVSGGTATLTNCTYNKTGDTSDSDGSSFYGTNAAILGTGGTLTVSGGTITTNAKGANGIVCYGGTINVSDMTINCTQNLSRGIHTTGGGTLVAKNLTITTAGNNSSVIALDRGGGTETVTGGTYTTTGGDCAVLYSTGTLTVNGITGSSAKGEIGVIEGSNSITINNSTITAGDNATRAMMILQSGSGDAGTGKHGYITATGGTLKSTSTTAPFIEIVTNCTGTTTLKGVSTSIASGILMKVDYNTRWSTNGATGELILSGSGTTYTGNIEADSYSTATVEVADGTVWKGAFDADNTGKSTTATIDAGGTWTLTANSYVDEVVNNGTINTNGYTLKYTSMTGSGTTNTEPIVNEAKMLLRNGSLSIVSAANDNLQLIDMMGRIVVEKSILPGETQINGVPAGNYVARLRSGLVQKVQLR